MSLEADRFSLSKRRDIQKRFYLDLNENSLTLRGSRQFLSSELRMVQQTLNRQVNQVGEIHKDDARLIAASQLEAFTHNFQEGGALILTHPLSTTLLAGAGRQAEALSNAMKNPIPKTDMGRVVMEFLELGLDFALLARYNLSLKDYQLDIRLFLPKKDVKTPTIEINFRPKPKRVVYR